MRTIERKIKDSKTIELIRIPSSPWSKGSYRIAIKLDNREIDSFEHLKTRLKAYVLFNQILGEQL